VNREVDWSARVAVSAATWRDWRSVMALEKLCFGRDAWSALDVAAALTFPDTVRLKAEFEDKLIGVVVGDIRSRHNVGWIATIAVHPAYRRRGSSPLQQGRLESLQTRRLRSNPILA